MSKFLITNKNLKLNVAASILPTEKVFNTLALKTERAKTIRNFFIQSGVEAARIAVKLTDKTEETPIVLTPQ
jgi:acetylornithine/succinyldiaminopimelate/putrescine aminotransferase